ncbi:MAG: hypothetical protein CSA81_06840 [Acidobacteria bacterium]|nr:MAG: hypothetical protein CSA81_06840 [Acidobacteriota bacterium]
MGSKTRKKMFGWLMVACAAIMMLSCGGGGNDEIEKSVFLQVTVDDEGTYVESEMIKTVTTTTVSATVCINSYFSDIETSVAHADVTRYELHFVRTDSAGTAQLPDKSGPLNINLGYRSAVAPGCDSFEIPVLSTDEKIYSELAHEFDMNPTMVAEFDVYVKVFGKNHAGDKLKAEGAFNLQCGAYKPYDELIPSIAYFSYNRDMRVGDNWNASWTAFGYATGGYLSDPFGRTVPLYGFDFPVGTYSVNTGFLADQVEGNVSVTYGTPLLIVGNVFGSTQSQGTDNPGPVTLYPQNPLTDDEVSIETFVSDRYNIIAGDSVNLSWVVYGAPTELRMSPSVFSGVPVSFEGKDLAFDSINIIPEQSVTPLLYASKSSNLTEDSQALDAPISVSGGGITPQDPEIQFFNVSHTSIPRFEQVALFWKVTGDYEKVEIFPINGTSKDVTGRESFFTPPLNRLGSNVFNLIVTGMNGSPIISRSVTVTVTEEVVNEAPEIVVTEMAPGSTMPNGATGAFTFTVDDPENQDSSWTVRKIAGGLAYYGPVRGKIPGGHGEATVSFTDGESNEQGYVTFEITAYDDINYGISSDTQSSKELVTFNTSDAAAVDAPTIEDVTFTAGNASGGGDSTTGTGGGNSGNDLLPGQDGVISFRVIDPGGNRMHWKVEIFAGDRGGTLDGNINWTEGALGNGGGYVAVHYQDDPDSTDDAVVFKITATQLDTTNPLSVIHILKVDYMSDGEDVLDFVHLQLYEADPANPGNVVTDNLLPFYLNYDGTVTNAPGSFLRNDGTLISNNIHLVTDIRHGTGDPGRVANVIYERDFITPISFNSNYGEFLFDNYYDGPGSITPIVLPVQDESSVSRWYNVFNVDSFQNPNTGFYNLPIVTGEVRDYQIRVRAFDLDNAEESVVLLLQIENGNPQP